MRIKMIDVSMAEFLMIGKRGMKGKEL